MARRLHPRRSSASRMPCVEPGISKWRSRRAPDADSRHRRCSPRSAGMSARDADHGRRREPVRAAASSGAIAAARPEGYICARCYRLDPLVVQTCGRCGKERMPATRLEDGTPLCSNCQPRRKGICIHCGKLRISVRRMTHHGPVCPSCYRQHAQPRKVCGICGEVSPIKRQANGDGPDLLSTLLSAADLRGPMFGMRRRTAVHADGHRRPQVLAMQSEAGAPLLSLRANQSGHRPLAIRADVRRVLQVCTLLRSALPALQQGPHPHRER
jgi:hypothetical protein